MTDLSDKRPHLIESGIPIVIDTLNFFRWLVLG
jgi:hypothetical protein